MKIPLNLLKPLLGFGLCRVVDEKVTYAVVDFVASRWADPSRNLSNALNAANDQAWQALAVALGGDGWLNAAWRFVATTGDVKAMRADVQAFLATASLPSGTADDFRAACLAELKTARKMKWLTLDHVSGTDLGEATVAFHGLFEQQGEIESACRAVALLSDGMAEFPHLARLLKMRRAPAPPLLVAAFTYFLRRQIATNPELARELIVSKLDQFAKTHQLDFSRIEIILLELGSRFDEILDYLVEIGGRLSQIDAKLDKLLADNQVRHADPRPPFHVSINSEDELRKIRQLRDEIRRVPADQQRALDWDRLGDLFRASGLYQDAQPCYADAGRISTDAVAKAAHRYKEYLTELERHNWEAALLALREAVALDASRFAPFPLRRFEIRSLLGAGGFGTAFRCYDHRMKREVVIKSLHTLDLDREPGAFFAEAHLLRDLSSTHPVIIRVLDCEYADTENESRPYIVMDYFGGDSLQAYLNKREPPQVLPLADFLAVMTPVAEAMLAVHQQGICHRDLKPDNILVRRHADRWEARIIDFGLAMRQKVVLVSSREPQYRKSLLGLSAAGTADFAPPEQMGKLTAPVGPYSDVYAFGKTCCYALFRTTQPLYDDWETIPESLRKMLTKCLREAIKDRYPSFEPVLHALQQLANTAVTPNSNLTREIPKKPLKQGVEEIYLSEEQERTLDMAWEEIDKERQNQKELPPKKQELASSSVKGEETAPSKLSQTALSPTSPWRTPKRHSLRGTQLCLLAQAAPRGLTMEQMIRAMTCAAKILGLSYDGMALRNYIAGLPATLIRHDNRLWFAGPALLPALLQQYGCASAAQLLPPEILAAALQ